jgi:TonB-dependent starch-binding outer membrane protein SusC
MRHPFTAQSWPVLLLALLLFPASAWAQAGSVTGRVLDAQTGEPLPGANVLLSELNRGGATDIDGRFTVPGVEAGTYNLVTSYVGFVTNRRNITVAAGQDLDLTVRLEPDLRGLEEVVVTGVASRTSRAVSPVSVSRVNAAELTEVQNYTSVSQLLTGKAAGVQVVQSSGNVGGGFRFHMRAGGGLYGTGQPVIYIDGVRVNDVEVGGFGVGGQGYSTLSSLNPDDIENIEIIKGAAGGALYGTSGSNGVVLITTKRGRRATDAINVNFRSQIGWNEQARAYDENTFISAADANAVFRRGMMTNQTLSIQGQLDRIRYFTSMDIRDEEGLMPTNEMQRNSFRANIEAFPTDRVSVRVSSSFNTVENTRPQNDNNIYGYLGNTLLQPRSYLYTDSLAILAIDNRIRSNQFQGSVELMWSPIQNLELSGRLGYDGTDLRNDATFPPGFGYAFGAVGQRNIWQWSRGQYNYDMNARYGYDIAQNLSATTIVGMTAFMHQTRSFDITRRNFASDLISNVGAGSDFISGDESFSNFREAGVFLQQEFSYNNIYYMTAGARYDFASTYGADAGDIFYPRADISVRLDQFNWAPEAFNLLKFRTAYGESGQLPGAFDAQPLLWTAASSGYGGAGGVLGRVGDPSIRPERIREWEIGLDTELRGGYGAELTYFHTWSSDALVGRLQPLSSGLTSNAVQQNVGSIEGWGVETLLYATPIRSRNTQLDLTATFTYQDTEVKDLGGEEATFIYDGFSRNVITEGVARRAFYLPVVEGANFHPETGAYTGVRYVEGGERQVIGSPLPVYSGAITANLRFARHFALSVQTDYALGHYVYNGTLQFGSNPAATASNNNRRLVELRRQLGMPIGGLVPQDVYSHIDPLPVGSEEYRAAAEEYVRQINVLSNFVSPADFLKLREVGLSFNATNLIRGTQFGEYVRTLTLAASGRNLLMTTKYTGPDPEMNQTGARDAGQSQDFLTLQNPRTYNFSISIGF